MGTTDNQPLELQVNGTRALRIEPHATSAPSLAGGYYQNSVAGFHGAAIAGGGTSAAANTVSGDYAFIGGGYGAIAGINSAVVGGAYNNAPGQFGFIGSGINNTNLGNFSFAGRGRPLQPYSAQWQQQLRWRGISQFSGRWNTVVAGGANNIADVNAAGVGGGSEIMPERTTPMSAADRPITAPRHTLLLAVVILETPLALEQPLAAAATMVSVRLETLPMATRPLSAAAMVIRRVQTIAASAVGRPTRFKQAV